MARNDALSGHPTAGTGGDYDQFLTIVEPQADLGKEAAELAAQRHVRAVFTAIAGGNALSHGGRDEDVAGRVRASCGRTRGCHARRGVHLARP